LSETGSRAFGPDHKCFFHLLRTAIRGYPAFGKERGWRGKDGWVAVDVARLDGDVDL